MNINLRQAKNTDIPELKKLWQICFNDRMKYINVFFKRLFVADSTVVAECDGTVVGVVYILNRSLNGEKFLYGYGIGVSPEYRGNNICKIMLDAIKEYCARENLIFGLHPANEKLAEFYQRIGLNEMYSLKEVDGTEFSSDNLYKLTDITADEFYNLRKSAFSNSVEWDKKTLEYILENGEIVKKITLHNKVCYFVINKHKNAVTVKESNANEEEIKEVSTSIKLFYDVENIKHILSSNNTLQGEVKPMVYGFSKKDDNVYMNLFLD